MGHGIECARSKYCRNTVSHIRLRQVGLEHTAMWVLQRGGGGDDWDPEDRAGDTWIR